MDPGGGGLDFVGTPDSIAAEMGEVMQEIGGDGFLFQDTLTAAKPSSKSPTAWFPR